MNMYFKTLDMLFDSNYKIAGPEALRSMMKNHLQSALIRESCWDKETDQVSPIIGQWKQSRLLKEENDLAARALLLL
jgi:hypothetical protein